VFRLYLKSRYLHGKVSVVKEGKRSDDGTWSPPMFKVEYMKRNLPQMLPGQEGFGIVLAGI